MSLRPLALLLLLAVACVGIWQLLEDDPVGERSADALREGDADEAPRIPGLEGDGPDPSTAPTRTQPTAAVDPEQARIAAAAVAQRHDARAATRGTVAVRTLIRLPDGLPADGARVTLRLRDGTVLQELIATRGALELEVAPGRYELIVRGAESTLLHVPVFTVTAATGDEPLRLQLARYAPLRVTVAPDSGRTTSADRAIDVALADVVAVRGGRLDHTFDEARAQALHFGSTDAGGVVDLGAAEHGPYLVRVRLASGTELLARYEHPTSRGAHLVVTPTRAVPVVLIDAARRGPVGDARILVQGPTRGGFPGTRVVLVTDRDGRALVPVGHTGVPNLEVTADGYLPWPLGMSDKDRRAQTQTFRSALWRWREGQDPPIIELEPGSQQPIRILVRTRDGTPVPGVMVQFRAYGIPDSLPPEREVETDATGHVSLTSVPAKGYRASVRTDAWHSAQPIGLTLVQPDIHERVHVIEVKQRFTLRGRVLGADDQGLMGARVWLGYMNPGSRVRQENEPAWFETFSGADGHWSIGGLHSHVSYFVHAEWAGLRVEPVEAAIYKQRTPLLLRLKPALRLEIRVREIGTGNGVGRAWVTLVAKTRNGTPPRSYLADAEGTLVLPALLPGVWQVQPRGPMHLPAESTDIDLTGRSGTVEMTLDLDPGLLISGRVVDGDGKPMRVPVSLNGRFEGSRGTQYSRRVETNAEGYFRISGLRVGEFHLMAFVEGTNRRANASGLVGGESDVRLVLK